MKLLWTFLICAFCFLACKKNESNPIPKLKKVDVIWNKSIKTVPNESYEFSYDVDGRLISINNEQFVYGKNGKVEKSIFIDKNNDEQLIYNYKWDNLGRLTGILVTQEDVERFDYLFPREYKYMGNSVVPSEIFSSVYKNDVRKFLYTTTVKDQVDDFYLLYEKGSNEEGAKDGQDVHVFNHFDHNLNAFYPLYSSLKFMPVSLRNFGVFQFKYHVRKSREAVADYIKLGTEVSRDYESIFNSYKYPTKTIIKNYIGADMVLEGEINYYYE